MTNRWHLLWIVPLAVTLVPIMLLSFACGFVAESVAASFSKGYKEGSNFPGEL